MQHDSRGETKMASQWVRSKDVVWEELDGEAVLVSTTRQKTWALNAAASVIWKCCDGQTSIDDIASKLAEACAGARAIVTHGGLGSVRLAWQAGQTLKLFTDEFRNPIPASVTARAVWELIAQNIGGLFHIAGGEILSRWQIGQLLAARWPEPHPRIEASSLRDYQGPARSANTTLNCTKIQPLLSFPLPGLGEWLAANPNAPV